ncbi:MAG: ABC transporter permease [Clostridium sp.]|uniref:ABC transporter permease n=1 Tax=Clostridium sp. TaxID=1506 RepID=UPI002FC83573
MKSKNKGLLFEAVRTLIAIGIALVLAIVLIALVSDDPAEALNKFLLGPLASFKRFANVIEMAIPFIFTGLAVCIMFQAKQFNMIAEGGFFIGGVAAAFIGIKIGAPMGIHPVIAILAGGFIGGLAGLIPGFLKAKYKADEFVSSLMLNYVLLYIGLFILNYVLRDESAGSVASHILADTSRLPVVIPGTRLHFGLILAIVAIILTYVYLYRTKWGYSIRMTGLNSNFAEYSGINTAKVIIYSQIIGGALAGIGGSIEILGMHDRFQWQALPGIGFDGILVAILARNNPLFVPIGAIFLAYLRVGADIMSRSSDVPSEVIIVIQAIMIMLIAAQRFLEKYRHKMIVKDSTKNLEVKGEK